MDNSTDTKKSLVKHKKLGEILLNEGLIDSETLGNALDIQKIQKKPIGESLIDMGAIDDVSLASTLSRQINIPFVRLNKKKISDEVISLFTSIIIKKHLAIPIEKKEASLVVAMVNPLDHQAIDDFQFIAQMYISVVVAPKKDILAAIEKYYPDHDIENDLDNEPDTEEIIEIIQQEKPDETDGRDLLDLAELPPVVRFVNIMLANAIKLNASDIHIEPKKNKVSIRCRVDGVMEETMKTDKHVHPPLVSRIKIISDMDISIRRKPQDGKAQVVFGGKKYDLRVSTIPTSEGEKVTMRILNPDSSKTMLEDLGFSDKDLIHLIDAISVTQGIVLVTGPTGSGKSSTLYACLNRLNTPEVNIVTIEDPVEYDIQGVNQVQIKPKAGVTFAAGLRSILRQDPDIVMVGEIRDSETAAIAFQAAQTGHLVLSTLHTNDAPSAVTRLLDLEVDDFLIFDSLVAVLGQRLVRRICEQCKVPDTPDPQIMERIRPFIEGDEKPTFWKGAGCDACHNKGYTGRMALFETLVMTRSLKEILNSNVSTAEIKKAAQNEGFQTLTMDGIKKAMQGLISLDEVFRVVPPEIEKDPEAVSVRKNEAEYTSPSQVAEANFSEKSVQKASQPKEQSPFTTKEEPPFVTEGPKVLVVDDNMITRKLISNMLASEKYHVLTAENGVEALEIVPQEELDLIITDFHMPQMDGITLVKNLKSQPSTRNIPIIMLTAENEVESEVEVLGAGADDYLVKPVDPKRFLARVRKFLNPKPTH